MKKLEKKGIAEKDIVLCAMADMNSDGVHCDNWLIVTDTDLIAVGGTRILRPEGDRKITDPKKLKVEFGEISYQYYPLDGLYDFSIEDQISISLLTACKAEPDVVLKIREKKKQEAEKRREIEKLGEKALDQPEKPKTDPDDKEKQGKEPEENKDKPQDIPEGTPILITYLTRTYKTILICL